jgi:hypothetical protein
LARVRGVRSPDANGLVLRGGGNVGLGENARGPCDITDPVGVTLEGLSEVVGFGFRARSESVHIHKIAAFQEINLLVIPDLDEVVTSTGHESALLAGSGVGADQATSKGGGSPANRVDTHSVGVECLVSPVVVTELEHTNVAIGRSAGKKASTLMGSPRNHVDRGSVEGEIEDLGPCATTGGGGRILGLFPPDQNLAIVRGGS